MLYIQRRFVIVFALITSLIVLHLWLSTTKMADKNQSLLAAPATRSISLFTLNIWFGNYKTKERMEAIGKAITDLKPDIITFQEVTKNNLRFLQSQEWFRSYYMVPDTIETQQFYFVIILSKYPIIKWTNLPFKNSRMGRNLLIAELKVEIQVLGQENRFGYFTIATSHLESMAYTTVEREEQLQSSLQILSQYEDVCLMGDLNIELKVDGEVQLPTPWFDTWFKANSNNTHSNGYTWDPSINTNAQVSEPNTTKDRFDRVFCKLLNFSIESMSVVGTKTHNGVFLSDHFGLCTKLTYGLGTVGVKTLVRKAKFMRPNGWEKFLNN